MSDRFTIAARLVRHRSAVAAVFLAFAAVELIVLVLLLVGVEGSVRAGPLRISVHQVGNPLVFGLALSVWTLVQERRRPRWRAASLALIAAFAWLGLVSLAREAPPITTIADIAVGELYTLLATKSALVVGPYSRFQWHHPGPLYFWLQAPFYALAGGGSTALYAEALAMNLAALIALAWVVARDDRGSLAALLTAGVVLFAWRAHPLLPSPWTAHIPVVASMTFVVLAAAIANGRVRLLPLLVVFGSLMAQTHLALVPLVAALGAGAVAAAMIGRSRGARSMWPVLNASCWLALLLWLLPLAEQVAHSPGNLTQLWRFFASDSRPGQPLARSIVVWGDTLAGALRPDFETARGLEFVASPHVRWAVPCALAQLVLLPMVARWAFRTRRRFHAWLALATMSAALVALWSITRIREDIFDHEVMWLAALGAMNMAVVAAAAVRIGHARWGRGSSVDPRIAVAACALLVATAGAIGVRDLTELAVNEPPSRQEDRAVVQGLYESILGYMRAGEIRKPLFKIDNLAWELVAPLFVKLETARVPFAVEDAWLFMFTNAFAATGEEDAVIAIGKIGYHEQLRERPGNVVVLARHPFYVDAIRILPDPNR